MTTSKLYIILQCVFAFFISCKKETNTIKETEIDNLTNLDEVQSLVRKIDSTFINYEVRKIQNFKRNDIECQENIKLANNIKVTESFYKTDFDQNGFTDLLVIGDNYSCRKASDQSCSYKPIVILNFGNKKYKYVDLSLNFNDYFVPKITKEGHKNLLEIYRPIIENSETKTVHKNFDKKILEYKFENFIEYNSNDKNYIPIEMVEFSTTGCFGTCPVFQLKIDKNKNAIFIAEHFNFSNDMEDWSKDIEGKFHTKIKDTDYQNLINLLQYIDFPNLKDYYSVNWSDLQTVSLKITYQSGKTKTIQDYGSSGTYGLKTVYSILFALRKNQNWIKD